MSVHTPLTADHQARRDEIRLVLRSEKVATQEDLRRLLAKRGFEVTQATLSRDLARVGARRVALLTGGTAYELPELRVSPEPDKLREMSELILSIDDNGMLVVLHTSPGTASAVALAIDQARLPEVLGTLAGDDTIFLAPSRGTPSRNAARTLMRVFGKGLSS
jgi:transcriptional regulator of arginine metabolism